jgi:hypothetical protein
MAMTTVYVVLQENGYGSADVRAVFTQRDRAEELADETGGQAYAAYVEVGELDEVWPEQD